MREQGEGLCFIGGAPRSGLTLLRRFLAAHPQTCCGSDTGVPVAIVRQARDFAMTLGTLHENEFRLDGSAVRSIFGRLLADCFSAPAARVVCEKTPINIVVFEDLAAMLPSARFIHVVRDGRDVVASLLQRNWRDPRTGAKFDYVAEIAAAARYWTSLAEVGLRAERTIGDKLLRIRYEDLVTDPDAILVAVARHLGVDAKGFASRTPATAMALSAVERESLPLLFGPITTERIGAARAALSSADLMLASDATAGARARLGYA
jgi:hypothetical protein